MLLSAVFAIAFGSVGFGALGALAKMLHGAWAVRSWEAVPVEILESSLRSSSNGDGGATYAVQARYRYEWAGRCYESNRVGLADGTDSDNIDGWHHAWETRLRAAQDGGPPVSAWVDPRHPDQAVLDPHLRWRKVLFMLPFALLFPMVALGAVGALGVVVTRIGRPQAVAPQRHFPRHHAPGLWLVATAVCLMTLPAVAVASGPGRPAWVVLIAGLFALVGLALLRLAVRATRRAWTYRGAFASFQPTQPRAGDAFQASWTLPPRTAARWDAQAPIPLRVAQYRIDDSGSGTTERRVEEFTQHVQPHPNPEGGLDLRARFELPADAPGQGTRRSGEQVQWRLEWLEGEENVVLRVPIPVQATAAVAGEPADRLAPGTPAARRDIPVGTVDDAMPPLPAGVILSEQPGGLALSFSQRGWRWWGAAALVAFALAFSRSAVGIEAALLALGLHAVSRRWTLEVRDDGILLDRASWLWQRRLSLPAARLPGFYERSHAEDTAGMRALWARGADRGNDVQLTPPLPANGALLIAQMLRWAAAQRAGRFSAGEWRSLSTGASRPGWGWAVCLLWMAARLSGLA